MRIDKMVMAFGLALSLLFGAAATASAGGQVQAADTYGMKVKRNCGPGDPNCNPNANQWNRPQKPRNCRPGDPNCNPHKPPHPGHHGHYYPHYNFYYWWTPGYYWYPGYDYYPPPEFADYRVSCREARNILRSEGFRKVRTTSCGGKYHRFTAVWRGVAYIVKVRARNGRITIVGRL